MIKHYTQMSAAGEYLQVRYYYNTVCGVRARFGMINSSSVSGNPSNQLESEDDTTDIFKINCKRCLNTKKFKEDKLTLEIGFDGDFFAWLTHLMQ